VQQDSDEDLGVDYEDKKRIKEVRAAARWRHIHLPTCRAAALQGPALWLTLPVFASEVLLKTENITGINTCTLPGHDAMLTW
jgi:hypothetical protein